MSETYTEDAHFSKETRALVKYFQFKHNCETTGKVDAQLWQEIMENARNNCDHLGQRKRTQTFDGEEDQFDSVSVAHDSESVVTH